MYNCRVMSIICSINENNDIIKQNFKECGICMKVEMMIQRIGKK